jgi:hypothetical protein
MFKDNSKSSRLVLTEDRKERYRKLAKILDEKTLSGTIDAAIEITTNLWEKLDNVALTRTNIILITGGYSDRFLNKPVKDKEAKL